MTPPLSYISVIIPLFKKAWHFIWTILNSLHPRIICTKFDSFWACWFWRRFLNTFSVFLLFCYYLPLERGYPLSLNTLKCLSPKDDLCQFWLFIFLFICFESHEQFFSYLATVTIAGDRAANLDLCLVLMAFSSEGSFTWDTGPPFLGSYPKDPWFYLLNAMLLAKEQSLPILNVLGLTWPAWAGLELTTYRLLSKSTTTRLKLVQWFWRGRFLNDPTPFLHFCDYLPFEEDLALYLKKLESPSPKDDLYQVWLNYA
jgi:hypothetical protein